jgi:CBS domain containing-hemolysin-like protein
VTALLFWITTCLFALLGLAAAGRWALARFAPRTWQAICRRWTPSDRLARILRGHEDQLETEAREMIKGVIELGEADVSEIMTPRTDMVTLAAALSWPEMLHAVIQAAHTRIPVVGRNRDDIIGILHARDLLAELAKPPEQRAEPWTKLVREPIFVPETKAIDTLLQELQRNRNHLAIVLDEYGGVSGLVTMEDALEEIVGEIADEHDTPPADDVRELGPGAVEAPGRMHIDELNERLGLALPEDADFDTVGGLVFSELGHVPVAGEELVRQNVRITVLQATRRRIERVRIETLPATDAPPGGEPGRAE